MSIVFTGPNGMHEAITSIGMYSDSTPMVKTAGWARIKDKADTITVTGGSMAQFITAMFLVDAVHSTPGGYIKRLVIPYVPGARQDRSNPTGDVLDTAYSVGCMINERFGGEGIMVLDPHSDAVMESIGKSAKTFPLAEVAKMLPNVYAGVIAADKGGQARAEEMAAAMDLPVYYGGKQRDVSTGQLTGFTLEPLGMLGNHFLVVDDICDGGGTFNGLAEKIKEQGATADLYVSHGLFAKGTRLLLKNFKDIYTTDSLDQSNNDGVKVLPVVEKMRNYN